MLRVVIKMKVFFNLLEKYFVLLWLKGCLEFVGVVVKDRV